MAVVSPKMIKFFGKYVKIYSNEAEMDREEQMSQLDFLRTENLRYFNTIVALKEDGKDALKDLGLPQTHPAVTMVSAVVSQFQHTAYLLLLHFEKLKDSKKYGPDPLNFFTPWPYITDIAKFAKLPVNILETAVGVVPGSTNRETWVILLHGFDQRYSRSSAYLLQSDFDQLAAMFGKSGGKSDPEDVFSRYMAFLYQKLSGLNYVLQAVMYAALNSKKK